MSKRLIGSLLFLFIFSSTSLAQQIKKPVVSGSFYPDSPKILSQKIKQFLDWADVERPEDRVLALISPHAGYDYSGSVAAYGFKLIKDQPVHTVVIIGPSHFEYFEGISVYPHGAWQTPLGNVEINVALAEKLIAYSDNIYFHEPAFAREHSIETQLPFLQMVLDDFQIVPIAAGKFSYQNCQILSQALVEAIQDDPGVLLVASTDMSHYHPYQQANQIDNLAIQELKKIDPVSLNSRLAAEECEFCGAAGVLSAFLYAQAKGTNQIKILKYANSGDITGEKERVVGYLSAAILAQEEGADMQDPDQDLLSQQQQARLLEIARSSIKEYLSSGARLEVSEDDPELIKKMGAFVTLHQQGKLRGCIGNIIGQQPLYLTVRDMAIEAAVNDHRFSAISLADLDAIDIEISVLSEPKRVVDPEEIKMGVHGVIVEKGFARGVFLPQVATETGWTKEEFLSNLCSHKAGLSPEAWKDKDTLLYSFTAEVFGEK